MLLNHLLFLKIRFLQYVLVCYRNTQKHKARLQEAFEPQTPQLMYTGFHYTKVQYPFSTCALV